MIYRIDPGPIQDGRYVRHIDDDATILLVGCGGTGGFLAEAICRLLIGRQAQLFLIDMDRVEAHNVARQAFLCGMEIAVGNRTHGMWRHLVWSARISVDSTPVPGDSDTASSGEGLCAVLQRLVRAVAISTRPCVARFGPVDCVGGHNADETS